MSDIRESHDDEQICRCVVDHNPNPMELHRHHIRPLSNGGLDVPENVVWLCPTSHVNVHELMRLWFRLGHAPDWSVERKFNPYIRELAERGYRESVERG